MKTKKRMLMVSLDAVSSDDLTLLRNLPHFSKLCKHGTLVKNVNSVLVSNTYPTHTSIITGTYPNKHGIVDNVILSPKRKYSEWCYKANAIRVPTLYEKAKEKGMKVCSILYPVTGGASSIDYNFPEIAGTMNPFTRAYITLKEGSAFFVLSSFWRHRKHFQGVKQPALDDFTTNIAADVLVRYKPDLLTFHLIDADAQKHAYGPYSKQAEEALLRHDKRIGKLIDALHDAGTYEETSIIIFSDHACLPVHTAIDPNKFLIEHNFMRKDKERIISYDAYFHNAGGTTFLKLYNPAKEEEVRQTIEKLFDEPYIGRLLTEEEMCISGMDKMYLFGVEAAGGFYFGKPGYKGQHGYALKREGYSPFYLAIGADIPHGEELSGGCIIDICPLAADMLEIPKWKMDGMNRLNPIE